MDGGDVRIGINLDDRGVADRISAAVHRAVAPAMARANAAVGGFNQTLGKVDGSKFRGVAGDADKARESIARASQAGEVFGRIIGKLMGGGGPGGGLPGLRKEVGNYHGILGQAQLMTDKFAAKVGVMSAIVAAAIPVIGLLGGAIGVLGGGIGVAVGSIGSLIAGMSALGPAIGGLVAALKIGFAGLKDGAKAYLAQFEDANKVLAAQIGNLMGPMLTAWEQVSSRIKLDFAQALVPTFNNLGQLIRTLGPALSGVATGFAGVANNVTATLNALAPQLQVILAGSRTLITAIGPGIQSLVTGMVNMGAAAQAAMPAISTAIRNAMTEVGSSMSQIATSPQFQQALQGFAGILAAVGHAVATLLPTLVNLGAQIGPLAGDMITALTGSLRQLLDVFGQLATSVGPIFNNFLAGIGTPLSQVLAGFGQLAEIIGPTLLPLFQALADGLAPLYVPLGELGRILSVELAKILPSVGQALASLGGPLSALLPPLGGLIQLIANAVTAIQPFLQGLATGIAAIAQGVITGLQPLIPVLNQLASVLGPILAQIGTQLGAALAAVGPVIAALVTALTPVAQIIGNVIVLGITNLSTIIQTAAPFITQFFQMLGTSLASVQPQITAFIQQLGLVLPQFLQQALPVMQQMFTQLAPAVQQLMNAFAQMLPTLVEITPQFLQLGLSIAQQLLPYLPALIGPFTDLLTTLTPLLPKMVEFSTGALQALLLVVTNLHSPLEAIGVVFNLINTYIGPLAGGLDTVSARFDNLWETIKRSPLSLIVGPLGKLIAMLPGGPNAPTGVPGAPGVPVQTPMAIGQYGGANAQRERRGLAPVVAGPGGAPMAFAGPQPFTPVAPDLGGGGGAGGAGPKPPETPVNERPFSDVLKTPAQEKLLGQIRDLLAGTGNNTAPLNSLKDLAPAVSAISTDLKKMLPASKLPAGAVGERMGPFGTPIPAHHPGYDAASAAIQALGGKPEMFIGKDPIDYATEQWQEQVDSWKTTTDRQIQAWEDSAQAEEKWANWQEKLTQRSMSGTAQTAIPGMPWTGTGGAAPAATAGQSQIAQYIYSQLTAAGYSPQVAQGAVASGLLESGLDPNNPGNPTHNSLFQTDKRYGVGNDPQSQVAWWLKEAASQGGPTAANADPLNFIADRVERGGYPGSRYNEFLSQAQQLIGTPTAPGLPGPNLATPNTPLPVQMIPSSGWFPGGNGRVQGSKQGLQPAAANLFDVITQQFPQIQNIGGVRADALPYHPSGRALDIMIPGQGGLNDPTTPQGKALGDQIYQFLMQNAQQLGIDTSGTLWQQKDHFNHIHAQVLQNAGFTPGTTGLMAPGMMPGMMPGMSGMAGAGGVVSVFVTNWPGQPQQGAPGGLPGQPIIDAGVQAAGQAAGGTAGDVISAIGGLGLEPWKKRQPDATVNDLFKENNPLAFASMAGLHVEDFSRQGGMLGGNIDTSGGGFNATGQLFSDTAALLDRTFSSLQQQLQAMREQMVDVLNQIKSQLSEDVLKPVVTSAVQEGISGIKDTVTASIGTALGNAAAPPIAEAVRSAIPSDGGGNSAGKEAASSVIGAVFDEGGPWPSGTLGINTSGMTEYVLTGPQYASMGQFATTGGVIGNDTVGAEFFGVSQIPIISTIVNLLVRVLLKVIGVEIEVRDTLGEMTDSFRSFRGDNFKAFDAQGRLLNDTSALMERTYSSQQIAADERIRILTQVIIGVVKFVIEKIIGPIVKAVGNAAVQAGAGAASAAINTQAPGAGNIVGALISGAGTAAVDVGVDVGTTFGVAAGQVITEAVFAGLQDAAPDLMTQIFSGAGLASLFGSGTGLGGLLSAPGNLLGSLLIGTGSGGGLGSLGGIFGTLISGGLFGGLLGGSGGGSLLDSLTSGAGGLLGGNVLSLLLSPASPFMTMLMSGFTAPLAAILGSIFGGAALFDSGGRAEGVGLVAKGTLAPERMLNPRDTVNFERLVDILDRGANLGGNTTIHAPFYVQGGAEGGEQARDRLLQLLS